MEFVDSVDSGFSVGVEMNSLEDLKPPVGSIQQPMYTGLSLVIAEAQAFTHKHPHYEGQQQRSLSAGNATTTTQRPVRRLSLKKSRAFGDLSGMSTSSSENSLQSLDFTFSNSKYPRNTNSRIRTSSEPNCVPNSEEEEADELQSSLRVKKTRSENFSVDSDSCGKLSEHFMMMGMGNRPHAPTNESDMTDHTDAETHTDADAEDSNGNSFNFSSTFNDEDFYFDGFN